MLSTSAMMAKVAPVIPLTLFKIFFSLFISLTPIKIDEVPNSIAGTCLIASSGDNITEKYHTEVNRLPISATPPRTINNLPQGLKSNCWNT